MMDGVQDIDACGGYADPVCQLLRMGEPGGGYDPAEWPDYSAEFGIGHEHVGALIGIACDSALHRRDPNSSAVWAPVHAWRALGQLRAPPARSTNRAPSFRSACPAPSCRSRSDSNKTRFGNPLHFPP